MKHPAFIARTILVKNNKVEEAVSMLNKVLVREGIISDARRIQYYEKPWQTRRRVCFIRAKAVCQEEMDRKVEFLSRKNRTEPYPGCY